MQNSLLINSAVVTGANGFIGRWLVTTLTQHNVQVFAFMRKATDKIDELKAWIQDHGGQPQLVTPVHFDLLDDQLGLDEEGMTTLTQTDVVYHLAAMFDFGLEQTIAHKANVVAATKLIALSGDNQNLKRFIHISGYRTMSRPAKAIDITSQASIDHYYQTHGAYEASKMIAHEFVRQAAKEFDVPLTRISPAIVIGDSCTGETTQLIGLADTIKQLWQGNLPVLVGSADTWLPVVTIDFLATLLAKIPSDTASNGEHYVIFDDRTPVLPKFMDLVASRMNRSAPKRHLPVNLVRNLPTALTGVDAEALTFISDDRYDPKPLADLCKRLDLTLPPIETSITRWVDYLLDTTFLERSAPIKRDRTIAGVRVFAEGSDEQADIVLLHGVLLDGQSWQGVTAELNENILNLDLPGLGRSAYGGGNPHEWITAALARLDAPATLVGHSLGTSFAVDFATSHPDRVANLVLISPFFLQSRPSWLLRHAVIMKQAFRFLSEKGMETQLNGAPKKLWEDAYQALRTPQVRQANAKWLAWAGQEQVRKAYREKLETLSIPITIIHGSNDPLLYRSKNKAINNIISIEDSGHYPQMTHPKMVAEIIRKVIKAKPVNLTQHVLLKSRLISNIAS